MKKHGLCGKEQSEEHKKKKADKIRKIGKIGDRIIKQKYLNGIDTKKLSEEFNCSQFTICMHLENMGIKRRKGGLKVGHIPWNKGKKGLQVGWLNGKKGMGLIKSNKKGKTVEEIYDKETANKMKNQLKENRANQVFPLKDTKPEIIAREFLDQLKIKYKQHSMINEIKYRYQCDFIIPKQPGINQKTILELDGNYWHANPEYNGNFMNYPQKIRANRIKDFERTAQLEEKGFKVIRLWEHEIKDMDLDKFKTIIKTSVL